jgi:DNA-binding MarR family transcriptional regulator
MVLTKPVQPRQTVAPDTHPIELQRLAFEESTHDECDPLSVQTLIWLFRAYNAVSTAQTEELRPTTLSPSAFNVLMALHNTDDRKLEPCQLATRLLISRPSVTGLLDTLQTKGLIERLPHADDRRRVLVRLTDDGLALLKSHFETHYREMNGAFADLSPDERATLVTLLRKVRGATPPDFTDEAAAEH